MTETDKQLQTLMGSLDQAEEVIKRMESTVHSTEEHTLIHETLRSHNLFMKIVAIIGSIFTVGLVIGGTWVAYYSSEDEKRLTIMETKLDILQNRTEFMEHTNKMMVDTLLKIQQAEIEKKYGK